MTRQIQILLDDVAIAGKLQESPTAELIWEALPIESEGNRWGDEIYCNIPVKSELDDAAKESVEVGDLGYWPPGQAFCIFFGPTPISQGREIRPASAVNIVGRVVADLGVLKGVSSGCKVRIEKLERDST